MPLGILDRIGSKLFFITVVGVVSTLYHNGTSIERRGLPQLACLYCLLEWYACAGRRDVRVEKVVCLSACVPLERSAKALFSSISIDDILHTYRFPFEKLF